MAQLMSPIRFTTMLVDMVSVPPKSVFMLISRVKSTESSVSADGLVTCTTNCELVASTATRRSSVVAPVKLLLS